MMDYLSQSLNWSAVFFALGAGITEYVIRTMRGER